MYISFEVFLNNKVIIRNCVIDITLKHVISALIAQPNQKWLHDYISYFKVKKRLPSSE